ncbi:MAG: apolipoprotein N-acyltransferase [Deltaproteobacteria bacterium]|nr:apolipoprotein N-acyltransferase [Deltaproteobacteria bacterium]
MLNWLQARPWRRHAAALVSAGLVVLAMPKFGLAPLIFIALTPLTLALEGLRPRAGFWLGFVYGFGANLGLMYWLGRVLEGYGGLPFWLSGVIVCLLMGIWALFPALWAAGLTLAQRSRWPLWLSGGLAWVGLEWVRGWFLTGLPWADLGYALTPWPVLIQMADLGGVGLASLVVVLTSLGLADLIQGRRRLLTAVVLASLWTGALGYGVWRLAVVEEKMADAPQVITRVVQANIDQMDKWDKSFLPQTLARYRDLSLAKSPTPPQLIVWTESAMPFYFLPLRAESEEVIEIVRKSGAWLVFGSQVYEKEGDQYIFYNRAWLLNPQGEVAGFYDKAHLVPYGEYVPLKRFFPFLGKITVAVGDFSAGSPGRLMEADFGRLGALICFESIFPELTRAHLEAGADLIVNISNDAWYGASSAPYQSLAMTIWRAVEARRSLARSAQTGISALIGPDGRMKGSLDLLTTGQVTGPLPILYEKTIYLQGGHYLAPACLILAGGIIMAALMRRRRDDSDR